MIRLDVYVRLDLVLQDVASTVTRTVGALKRLTDDRNFICESSKRKTIFKDMSVSGEAFFLHSMNLVQQKLLPQTYRIYIRTTTHDGLARARAPGLHNQGRH